MKLQEHQPRPGMRSSFHRSWLLRIRTSSSSSLQHIKHHTLHTSLYIWWETWKGSLSLEQNRCWSVTKNHLRSLIMACVGVLSSMCVCVKVSSSSEMLWLSFDYHCRLIMHSAPRGSARSGCLGRIRPQWAALQPGSVGLFWSTWRSLHVSRPSWAPWTVWGQWFCDHGPLRFRSNLPRHWHPVLRLRWQRRKAGGRWILKSCVIWPETCAWCCVAGLECQHRRLDIPALRYWLGEWRLGLGPRTGPCDDEACTSLWALRGHRLFDKISNLQGVLNSSVF